MGEVFDRKSLYARNKLNPDAIVYPDINAREYLITKEDFSSETEFRYWKEWSDSDYHTRAKHDNKEADHTLPMDNPSSEIGTSDSVEDFILQEIERKQQQEEIAGLVIACKAQVTEIQFRRIWLCFVYGKTHRAIAAMDGVSHQAVSKSIRLSKEKIKNFCKSRKTGLPNTPQNPNK